MLGRQGKTSFMVDSSYTALLKQIAHVQEAYPLSEFSVLHTGGIADYFTVARSTVELAAAVKAAMDGNLPYIVIGEGSQLLFSDGGFPGLVIHNKAQQSAVAREHTQIVVDSGMPLRNLVTLAANQGLGGLTAFYRETGTLGGAIYSNKKSGGSSILSLVRYVTFIMPAARLDKEATIVRHPSDWLIKSTEETKLQYLKRSKKYTEAQPVILTVLLQLTNVRNDELSIRLQKQAQLRAAQLPRREICLGPLFDSVEEAEASEFLRGVEAHKVRVGNCGVLRSFPNYLIPLRANKPVLASDIRAVIEQLQQAVEAKYSVRLPLRYEYVGGVVK